MVFFFRLVAFGCVVLLTICGLIGAYVMVYLREPGPLTEAKEVQIPAGASSGKIASILGDAGVVRYPDLFSISVRVAGASKNFQAGEYVFTPAVSASEVVHKMLTGDVIRRVFTIPEGRTSVEVSEMLRQNQFLTGDVDIPPEGSLLPETYDYRKGESRQALVSRMRKAMDDAFAEAWKQKDANLPVKDRNQALTLASVIEKETGKASERPMVASVFVNRLRVGMRLQSDPTVIYGVTDGAGDLGRPISRKDLQFNSPYNTYVIDGLPPAPICNPGKESIRAALHPARSEALYFVADGTGAHRFAATLEEHNANVQVLRAWEAKRRGENPSAASVPTSPSPANGSAASVPTSPSPASGSAAPVADPLTPASGSPASVPTSPSPASGSAAPVADPLTPASDSAAPVAAPPSPASGSAAPVAAPPSPASGSAAPVAAPLTPASGSAAPVADPLTPASGSPAAVAAPLTPASGSAAPVAAPPSPASGSAAAVPASPSSPAEVPGVPDALGVTSDSPSKEVQAAPSRP